MKILLVLDQFDSANNGTTISARRFADVLRRHGHQVRVVSTGQSGPDKYCVPEVHLPLVDGLITSQGMVFAYPDKAVLRTAIAWADVVHFLLPFPLGRQGRRIAAQLGVPCTAAFHTQPENITYSIGLGKLDWVNSLLYRTFYRSFYRYFDHIHCPSRFIADQLEQHGYDARLHVVSNGIDADFTYRKLPKPPALCGKFVILMIGRLSNEKRQDVLIEAVRRSRHASDIQLVLAGRGPRAAHLRRLGAALPHPPLFGFYTKEQLLDVIATSDLYVHAADVEIEAISCIEAFACGLVPVIANSAKSATPQFALDERSLFTAGDSADLAAKIDYWIDHADERRRMEHLYSAHGRQYDIDACVRRVEEMFSQSIAQSPGASALERAIGPDYDYLGDSPGVRLGRRLLKPLARLVLPVIHRACLGLRVTGRKNLSALPGAFVSVCNHVHPLDGAMVGCALGRRRVHFLTLQSNLERPFVRLLLRPLGGLPIPRRKAASFSFYRAVQTALARGDVVHVFPEGHLSPYCDTLRPFQNGAFAFAYDGDVPIVPMVLSYRPGVGLGKKLRRRPLLTLHILEPIYPDTAAGKHSEIQRLKNLCTLRMQDTLAHPQGRRRRVIDLQQRLARK
ncbi:MAG: glycosyltransferase [Eubacteriales bacterium]|nr:glycosyltransferase [Eubacteriales bacterium]